MVQITLEYDDRYSPQELDGLRRNIAKQTGAICSYSNDTRLLDKRLKEVDEVFSQIPNQDVPESNPEKDSVIDSQSPSVSGSESVPEKDS
jgi:hypothetical protein